MLEENCDHGRTVDSLAEIVSKNCYHRKSGYAFVYVYVDVRFMSQRELKLVCGHSRDDRKGYLDLFELYSNIALWYSETFVNKYIGTHCEDTVRAVEKVLSNVEYSPK